MLDFMLSITRLGSPQVMLLLTFFISVFLWHHKKNFHLFQFCGAMMFGALSVYVLKEALQIPRPLHGLVYEYGYGFPSGHTTMATLFFLLVIASYKNHIESRVLRIAFIISGIVMIGSISYSRIYLGVHSWLDVIGGYALGSLWFILSLWFHEWMCSRFPHIDNEKNYSLEIK